jgi:predicted acetyltransferase
LHGAPCLADVEPQGSERLTMPTVDVTPAGPDQRAALENLTQLYIHDFSEFWRGTADGELGPDGRFSPYALDAYWRDEDRVPLVISVDGGLAGFALLNRVSHSGRAVDRNMAEFFVARKHRRGGVGTRAARLIFSRYPGRWETAVARKNLAALAFWRRVIEDHPSVSGVERLDLTSAQWNGPVFRFRIGG